jgi:hypothetical protein
MYPGTIWGGIGRARTLLPAAVPVFLFLLLSGCSSTGIPDTGMGSMQDSVSTLSPEWVSGNSAPLVTQTYSPQILTPTYSRTHIQSYLYPIPGILPTSSPSPTPDTSPTPSLIPSPSPSPTATPTPDPTPFRLTEGGCCPHPFWSSSSDAIYFVGSPYTGSQAGLWKISLEEAEPEFLTPIVGIYSPDVAMAAFPLKGQTFIERLETGEIWLAPSGGRKVHFSPDGSQIAWTAWELLQGKRFLRPIWFSQADGTHAQEVTTLYGWGFIDWFPDGRFLVHGRYDYDEEFNAYWIASPDDDNPIELVRGFRLSYGSVSPGGRWVAYHNVLDQRPEENGLWVIDIDTLQRQKLDFFGPFQWRSEGRLVVIPLEVGTDHHRLIEIDMDSGTAASLVDPESLYIKIAGGDWALSPDGRWLAYLSAEDFNIWVLELSGR